MLVIKLRSKYIGKDRIEETVFIGQEGFTLQNAGRIVMSVGEWQMFGAVMLLGADQVKAHRASQGHESDVKVIV